MFPVLCMLSMATTTAVSVLCLFAWYTSFQRFLAAGNSGLIHNTIVPVLGAIHAIPLVSDCRDPRKYKTFFGRESGSDPFSPSDP